MEWKYLKPLKELKSIQEVEKTYNVNIPQYLKNIILEYNGSRPELKCFDTQHYQEKALKSLLSYNKEDKENIYMFDDIFSKGYIPFAITEFGDLICIENKSGNIKLYMHEQDIFEYICETIGKFFEILYL